MVSEQCAVFYDEGQLPKECLIHSEKELGETKLQRDEKLRDLISWMDSNSHIKLHAKMYSNFWLMYFLRATKFCVDKAKCKILKYHKMRMNRVEWFTNRDPFLPEIKELLDLGVFLPLLRKDDQNRQVFIIRTAAHNPHIHSQNNVLKVGQMLLDLILYSDETISIYGVVAIFDMKDVTLGHALQLPPKLIKRLVESWESYPCLVKQLEFVNAPLHINAVLNTFRFFMTSKMKSRVCVTSKKSTWSTGTSILPKDLGGTGESYEELATYWTIKAQENRQFFHDMEQCEKVME